MEESEREFEKGQSEEESKLQNEHHNSDIDSDYSLKNEVLRFLVVNTLNRNMIPDQMANEYIDLHLKFLTDDFQKCIDHLEYQILAWKYKVQLRL